jgi:hypothetical protein
MTVFLKHMIALKPKNLAFITPLDHVSKVNTILQLKIKQWAVFLTMTKEERNHALS